MWTMRWICTLMLLLVPTPAVLAAPKVVVRAKTSIWELRQIRRGARVALVGRLMEQDFNRGVPGRVVTATVMYGRRVDRRAARTNRQGWFVLDLGRAKGIYRVLLRFDGDTMYAAHREAPREVDVSKQTLDLGLAVDRALDASQPTQSVTASAALQRSPVSARLALSTPRGKVLARGTTSLLTGKVALSFPTRKLGRPGPKTLVLSFAGSQDYNRAYHRFETVLETPVYLSLEADEVEVAADEEVELSGRMWDPTGPVSGATVTLHAMGGLAGSVVTDDKGRFELQLDATSHPPGELDVVARFSPNVLWRRRAESRPVMLSILAPRPIPWHLFAIPAVFSVVALVGLAGFRFRREVATLVRRHTTRGRAPVVAPAATTASGVRLARRTLRSLITKQMAVSISGQVWDATDCKLLPGARLLIRDHQGNILDRARTDGVGRFQSSRLPVGQHQALVQVEGYVSETFGFAIPHPGNLDGLRVDLVQVRVRVLELYREAALPLLPKEKYWAHWTPRELLHHLNRKAGRRNRLLEQLTLLLEGVYWSRGPSGEGLLDRAQDLVRGVREGLTQRY